MLKGSRQRGRACRFPHDKHTLAEARATGKGIAATVETAAADVAAFRKPGGKRASAAKGGGEAKRAGAKQKGTTKGKAKKTRRWSIARNSQTKAYVCYEWLKSTTCSHGKECKYSHDLTKFDANGKPKMKSACMMQETDKNAKGADLPTPVGLQKAHAQKTNMAARQSQQLRQVPGTLNPFQDSLKLVGNGDDNKAAPVLNGRGRT